MEVAFTSFITGKELTAMARFILYNLEIIQHWPSFFLYNKRNIVLIVESLILKCVIL